MSKIKKNNNKIFVCPNNNCINIPEISYSYEPLNPLINYKCNNSNLHILIEEKMKLEDFIRKTSIIFQCSLCKCLIFEDELIFERNTKKLYHFDCLKKHGLTIDKEYLKINTNYLFNYCLDHHNKFIFFCQKCNTSLCSKCELEIHIDKGHFLTQINSLRNNKRKIESFISIVSKQRTLLNKIKDMINKLMQSLENDIIIKEQILDNYEKNEFNYQSIQNFINFKLKNNNEKYVQILDDIVNSYKEFEKNSNNKNISEIFVNTLLSPLYYSFMISDDSQNNENILKLLNKNLINMNKEDDLNKEKSINKSMNIDNALDKNDKQDIKNNLEIIYTDNSNYIMENIKYNDNIVNNENNNITKNKGFKHKEIKNINHQKSIYNMIILHSGNIAISSCGNVIIYDSSNLLSSN